MKNHCALFSPYLHIEIEHSFAEMCKASPLGVVERDNYLRRLDATKFQYKIDKNNRLSLVRKLPPHVGKPPLDLIPPPVLALYEQFSKGALHESTIGKAKYHDRIKTLRRYSLIPTKVAKRELTESERVAKRAMHAQYLRDWRRKHSACSHNMLSTTIVCAEPR